MSTSTSTSASTTRTTTTQKNENVTYLRGHSEQLSRRLQELLDRQWDGLSERKGRWIVSARQGIDDTMNELLDTQTALLELYQAELSSRRAWLERTKLIQDKITSLTQYIEDIESGSDVAHEISDLEREQSGINAEIAELQFKLKQLYSRKLEISTKLERLQSSVSARTSSYKHELEALKKKTSSKNTEPRREAETYSREVDAIQDQQSSTQQEITALKDGIVVWRDVCLIINQLEAALKDLAASMEQPDKVYDKLKSAAEQLHKHMEIAKSNSWSLLAVAISHELEALNEGMQLVSSHREASPSKSTSTSTGSIKA